MNYLGRWSALILLAMAAASPAVEILGGQTQTAESLPADTYLLLLSPAYLGSDRGTYLSAKLRYQPAPAVGVGFAFGTGEAGFGFGMESSWQVFRQGRVRPAAAVRVSFHFDRADRASFFVAELAPIVSRSFHSTLGEISPYGGLRVAPSFGLGPVTGGLAVKSSLGGELTIAGSDGLQVWSELGLGLHDSADEIVLGLAYPFTAL